MIRLKLTQKQYNTILLNEQRERLEARNSMINENTSPNTELLKEGWKEVVLGIALMLGVGLTGQNKIVAQDAVKSKETMSKIKETLEDEDSLAELVDALSEKGMKNPENKLSKDPEELVNKYNITASANGLTDTIGIKAALALNTLTK